MALRGMLSSDNESARHFEGCQFFPAAGGKRFGSDRHSQHHEGDRHLATKAIGAADHGGFGHLRLFQQKLLDLARIDVEAAGDDEVALAAAKRVVAVGRKGGQVAGAEPAVDERCARGLFAAPVAGEDIRALADRSRRFRRPDRLDSASSSAPKRPAAASRRCPGGARPRRDW